MTYTIRKFINMYIEKNKRCYNPFLKGIIVIIMQTLGNKCKYKGIIMPFRCSKAL